MFRIRFQAFSGICLVVFLPQSFAGSCGSNEDWQVTSPSGEVDKDIGDLYAEGVGYEEADSCQARIYKGSAMVDWGPATMVSGFWTSTIERTAAWPLGAAQGRAYCSNNGGPMFHIGDSSSITFVDLGI